MNLRGSHINSVRAPRGSHRVGPIYGTTAHPLIASPPTTMLVNDVLSKVTKVRAIMRANPKLFLHALGRSYNPANRPGSRGNRVHPPIWLPRWAPPSDHAAPTQAKSTAPTPWALLVSEAPVSLACLHCSYGLRLVAFFPVRFQNSNPLLLFLLLSTIAVSLFATGEGGERGRGETEGSQGRDLEADAWRLKAILRFGRGKHPSSTIPLLFPLSLLHCLLAAHYSNRRRSPLRAFVS
nr:unnamed protein product [Digitaria exilis]